eukprot:Anaeramoba_flamelloidesa358726_26.p1 GENE.a358726_26~~a358726_26.p1  ORF type:complete len:175 (-),score=15.09 a358726_26:14-538(-)
MLNWLFGNDKKKKKKTNIKSSGAKTTPKKTKAPATRKTNTVAQTMDLPEEMRYIDLKTIRKIMHSIIQTYKMLEYSKKKDSELSEKEWHSWQVGIMFKLYQSGDRVFIGKEDREKIFPKDVLKGGESSAERVVENLAQKYSIKVNLKANKDALCRDFSWNAREVGNLLYVITEQ